MERLHFSSVAAVCAIALTAMAGCVGDGNAIRTGALPDAGEGSHPGSPDAGPVVPRPDARPGTPDAQPGAPDATPAAPETLTVQFTTTSNNGQFSPRNIVAVWMESSSGTFEKTIGRWAGTRRSHLVGWIAKAGSGDTDAVSGATRQSHSSPLVVHWDFKNKAGQVVPDGTYTIRMELADDNAFTASQNHQGTFTVTKNGTGSTQSTSGGGFNGVSIVYSGR